jgi:hypothetical protein
MPEFHIELLIFTKKNSTGGYAKSAGMKDTTVQNQKAKALLSKNF